MVLAGSPEGIPADSTIPTCEQTQTPLLLESGTPRPLSEPHGDDHPPSVAQDRETDELPWRKTLADDADELIGAPDVSVVNLDNNVAAEPNGEAVQQPPLAPPAQAGVLARALGDDGRDHCPALHRIPEALRDRRRQILCVDTDVGVRNPAVADELAERALGSVDRDREAHALGLPRITADLGVDAKHPAARVEEGAARVPVRDRCIRLDRVADVVAGRQRVDRAPRRRHDTDRERALVAERATEGGNGLTDDNPAGVPERHRIKGVRIGIDLENGHIVEDVPPDHRRLDTVLIAEAHVYAIRSLRLARLLGPRRRHDVRARQDVALSRADEA